MDIFAFIFDLIFPIRCSFCERIISRNDLVCTRCKPTLDEAALHTLADIKVPQYVDQVLAGCIYTLPIRLLMQQFKFQEATHHVHLFHKLIEQQLKPDNIPDLLIPMPLHPKKLSKRGYNQSAILLEFLNKKLRCPTENLLLRTQETSPQTYLSQKERKKDLRHTFAAKPCPFSHVVIIDDVFTTGATGNAAAYHLKKQGAKRVDIWVVAASLKREGDDIGR